MKNLSLFTLCALLLAASCKKEGIGGDATIRGYVHARQYNTTFTAFISQYPARDVYVYIVFGNNTGYDKRLKTDYNGNFEFRYLYKGDYKVYAYSKDSTLQDPSCLLGGPCEIPVIKDVHISERKQVFNIDTLLIYKW
jgi:hypothetical protein